MDPVFLQDRSCIYPHLFAKGMITIEKVLLRVRFKNDGFKKVERESILNFEFRNPNSEIPASP